MRPLLLSALLFLANDATARPKPTAVAEARSGAFAEVDRLAGEQKFEAALVKTREALKAAREKGDDALVTEALIKATQLEMGLHGYETAVRALREAPWPKDGRSRVLLNLYYGHSLMNYHQQYAWEVNQREKTVSASAVDLKAWTTQQIGDEIARSFDAAGASGPWLDEPIPPSFRAYLVPNDYPEGVRPTLRAAVSYLAAEHLANQQFWSAKEANEVFKLGAAKLTRHPPRARLAGTGSAHPLERAASWLGELERVYDAAGRGDAAREARYTLFEIASAAFREQADKAALVTGLREFQGKGARTAWWARGQALLANLVRGVGGAGSLVVARREAIAGRDAFPAQPGGKMCAAIVWEIERPELHLGAMASDAPSKRSVLLTYRNLRKAWFRAYPVDLDAAIRETRGYGLAQLDQLKLRALLSGPRPAAAWSADLAETADYVSHRHFVTPPPLAPGLYRVLVSLNSDFSEQGNLVEATALVVGDLVLSSRPLHDGSIEARVLSGETGRPVAGAHVSLYNFDYQSPPVEVRKLTTDAEGYVEIPAASAGTVYSHFLVARAGKDVAIELNNVYFGQPPQEAPAVHSAFVFTDRSIYRPQQKLLFKVVAFTGKAAEGRYAAAPAGETVKIKLLDPNHEPVAEQTLTVGAFGSASGEFTVPPGRPLGSWMLQTSPASGGASVRIEEYKRPTFEATMKEAAEPLRLNRKAHVEGEALYYFGLPVTAGAARWRVTRSEVLPWWWGFWGWWRRGQSRAPQTVAAGTAEIGRNGAFSFDFLPEADERRKGEKDLSYRFEVSVDVTDEGGETRSVSRVFRLGFVSVETKLAWDEGFFLPGKPFELRASLTDLDGKARKGEGRYRLSRLAAPGPQLPSELPREEGEPEPGGEGGGIGEADGAGKLSLPGDLQRARWETGFRWEAVTRAWKEAETVAEGRVDHDAKGEGKIAVPALAKPGVYRVSYSTKDAFGATFEATRDFLVAGEGIPLPVLAVLEKASVSVGEKARLFVHSGFRGQPLTLERWRDGKRLDRRGLEAGGSDGVLELPVTEADRGGFTLTVSGLRDHQPLVAEANVSVPWSDRQLQVEFLTFRDKLRPGAKETFKIRVKSDKGVALEQGGAEVLAYMYDRSLDFFGSHGYPQAASLYPTRYGAAGERFTIGQAPSWTLESSLPAGPYTPYFRPDQLQVYATYGIGGPGSRRARGRLYGEALGISADVASEAEAGMPAAANMARAAPARQAEKAEGQSSLSQAKDEAGKPASPPPPAPVGIRANFSETAFFAPHLLLGPDGTAAVELTAPDSVTSWRVLAHALTRDLRGGTASQEARTVKELMVRPYAPRFLREGDEAEIRVQVNNAGDETLSGELTFEIEGLEAGKSALADFGVKETKKRFQVEKGGSVTLAFPLKAPRKVGDYAFRVTAKAGAFEDGERRPFPVLPSRLHLAQSRFVSLHGHDRKTLEFKDLAKGDDPTLASEKLVVTVDAQLFYGVLQALPYLVQYPYECVEQTLNRFLSTGIVSSVMAKYPAIGTMAKEFSKRDTRLERFDDIDANRRMSLEETPFLQEAKGGPNGEDPLLNVLDPENARRSRDDALAQLAKQQLPSGAFPWFQGGPPDEYMTLYILLSLTRALEFRVDIPKSLVTRAWGFERQWLDEHLADMLAKDYGWEAVTQLNFALSGYPDASWTNGQFDEAYRRKLLGFSFKHWKEHSPLLKGYLALTLKRMQREKDARLVWDSVMDSAKHDEQLGTFWAREDRSWLWYRDEIDTHAFALRTQMELARSDRRNDGLVQWLFLNKKLNHWKSTRATAEVIYSLAHYLDATNQLGQREQVKVELGHQTTEMAFEPEKYTGKKNQIVVPGEKVDPKTMSRIPVSKDTPGFAFASATWQFATDKLPAEDRGDFFRVSRRYFRREHKAGEWRLTPLAEGAKIAVGDELEVQLSLRAKHAAEYVHLRDPRGAGFEPESVRSGWKWDLGLAWYEETRDSGANFFFSTLPVGEYTFKYRVRANMAGSFRVGPAEVQSMYAPEFNAYSAGSVISVAP